MGWAGDVGAPASRRLISGHTAAPQYDSSASRASHARGRRRLCRWRTHRGEAALEVSDWSSGEGGMGWHVGRAGCGARGIWCSDAKIVPRVTRAGHGGARARHGPSVRWGAHWPNVQPTRGVQRRRGRVAGGMQGVVLLELMGHERTLLLPLARAAAKAVRGRRAAARGCLLAKGALRAAKGFGRHERGGLRPGGAAFGPTRWRVQQTRTGCFFPKLFFETREIPRAKHTRTRNHTFVNPCGKPPKTTQNKFGLQRGHPCRP